MVMAAVCLEERVPEAHHGNDHDKLLVPCHAARAMKGVSLSLVARSTKIIICLHDELHDELHAFAAS